MTETISGINQELINTEKGIYNTAVEYKRLATEAANKRVAYDLAYATELLKIKTDNTLKLTAPEKEATALLAVQGQFTECRIAEAMAESCKRHLQALQGNQTSLQTRASLIKTEAFVTNHH